MPVTYLPIREAEALLRKGWLLQICSGSRLLDGWAWMRRRPGASDSQLINRRSAALLIANLGLEQTKDELYANFYYRLPKRAKKKRVFA